MDLVKPHTPRARVKIDDRYEETLRAWFFHLNRLYDAVSVEKILEEKGEKHVVKVASVHRAKSQKCADKRRSCDC